MLHESTKSGDVNQAAVELPDSDVQVAFDSNDGPTEESTTPKTCSVHKISLSGSPTEAKSTGRAGRKRRWGFSTTATPKKPLISITTDSLKSLVPDVKPAGGQEAVVELHPDEGQLSGGEEVAERDGVGETKLDAGQTLQCTITQVDPNKSWENGEQWAEQEAEPCEIGRIERDVESEAAQGAPLQVSMESEGPATETTEVTPGDTTVHRSVTQQKMGVSLTIDDPVPGTKRPSPPRGRITNIVHICNLVRPFTLGQLKELLNRTGTVLEEGFWIDRIKSHCYVTYSSTEEALATRSALHGVRWPQSNPKFLSVDFAEQDELDFHRSLMGPERGTVDEVVEREQRAEREREMERRERTRGEREWDRDKVGEFGRPPQERDVAERHSRDRERRRKERRADRKEKTSDEPPAKLLDDLFCKTKAAPCIYWLPLTEEQVVQRAKERAERMKEREKRRKELQEEEERKEKMKSRDKEVAEGGGKGALEGQRDRDRGRDRERDGDKKEAYRSRASESRPAGGAAGALGGGRRSRSRSNPSSRDRRH